MKVIFLDIDGVLNVIPQGHDDYGGIFHTEFVDNLKYIIDKTKAKIVISSSWKSNGLDVLQKMWEDRKLPGEVIDITPNVVDVVNRGTCEYYDLVDRGYEIQQWIDDNNPDNYCIIDDDNDMLPSQMSNFVRTINGDHPDSIDIGYGLTKKCSKKVIKILNDV